MLSAELICLLLASVWQLLISIPYVVARVRSAPAGGGGGYPDAPAPMAPWTERLRRAHYNLVENMTPFVVAVLAGEILGVHSAATVSCAVIFLLARIAHPFAQMSRLFAVRTAVFAIGWLAVLVYLLALLGVQ